MLNNLQTLLRRVLTSAPSIDFLCSGLCLLGNGISRSHGEVEIVLMRGRGRSVDGEVLVVAGSEASATGNAKLQAAATTCASVC